MTPEEELVKVKANFDRYLADLDAAAGEFKIPVPEPGTDMAKLLAANLILKRRVENLKKEADPATLRDWENAHGLLDRHGVKTGTPTMGVHLIERITAALAVWDAIGKLSAASCHDLRFLCNVPQEVIEAIAAHRAAFTQPE